MAQDGKRRGSRTTVDDPVNPAIEHMGGINLPLRQAADSNASALVGHEGVIQRLAHEFSAVIDAAVAERIAKLAQDFKDHPDRYLPRYEPPEQTTNGQCLPTRNRGRKLGGTNISREYFWEQYRHAVDGFDGFPRMERPYRKSHFPPRTTFTYKAFDKYLRLWGPPPGYARPGE